jgi:hypothetical protein
MCVYGHPTDPIFQLPTLTVFIGNYSTLSIFTQNSDNHFCCLISSNVLLKNPVGRSAFFFFFFLYIYIYILSAKPEYDSVISFSKFPVSRHLLKKKKKCRPTDWIFFTCNCKHTFFCLAL